MLHALVILAGLYSAPLMAASPPMPPVVVLIVCKTEVSGEQDQNSDKTGWQNREWAYVHSMMQCRREEVQMYDKDVDQGAAPRPFTPLACQNSAIGVGVNWDMSHRSSNYRFWRVACPVPIVSQDPVTKQETVIGWKLPDCGHRDTVVCEVDTEI